MRNYFSQLAKQSGLRRTGQSEKTRDVEKSTLAPLHQEKTTMIESHSPSVKPAETRSINLPKIQAPKITAVKRETIEAAKNDSFVTVEPEAEKYSPNRISFETVAQNPTADFVEVSPPSERSVEPLAINPPTVEQVVILEPETPKAAEFSPTRQSFDVFNKVSTDKSPTQPPERQTYFVKTSEILKKGEASQLEIQQTLLQEVRQWAADTPDAAEYAATEVVEAKQPTVKIVPPPIESESVVRENSAVREDANQGLEEQSLSLSIGTISIVVEDTSQPPPPENVSVIRTNSETRSGETKRRFSSLRRNYL